MRKIYGIGETVYDILFKNGKPVDAVAGGSVFNGLISLGRTGADCTFITEIGDDAVGQHILSFMKENGIDSSFVSCYKGRKTAISLAYLNSQGDASYSFYKDYPGNRLDFSLPPIQENDIVAFGAYYALNPVLQEKVGHFLEYAKSRGAILYYDLNFRSNHCSEVDSLRDTFIRNYKLADIVRGSHEDLENIYGHEDFRQIYKDCISPYCSHFICTRGSRGVFVLDGTNEYSYASKQIEPVSTIGAGDNFNAGIMYGLISNSIGRKELEQADASVWKSLASCGIDFGTEACLSTSNYVSIQFASEHRLGQK
ncbi:MAG: carbohydrate kinase [Bacteroidaceae bacterium]|nr:carbohydrate kinase [Bacteroidaceae bacterium]